MKNNSIEAKKIEILFALIKDNIEFKPFKVNSFIKWLSITHCKRHIIAKGWQFPIKNICGVWFTYKSTTGEFIECIFYDNRLPKPLQLRTILHEAAHILCGHTTVLSSIKQFEQAIQNPLQFKIFCEHIAQRNSSGDYNHDEQEAEALAHLIHVEIFSQKNEHATSSTQQGHNYLQAIGCE